MQEKLYIYKPDGKYVGLIEVEDPYDAIIGLLIEVGYHLYKRKER